MKRILLSIMSLSILSCVGLFWLWADGEETDERGEGEPGMVIEYYVLSSFAPYSVSYSLRQDGKLSFQRFSPTTKKVVESQVRQLDDSQMLSLVREGILDRELLQCGEACIENKVKASLARKRLPRASDANTTILKIDLRAEGSLVPEGENLQQDIRFHSLGMLSRLCPEVEELKAITELGKRLQDLFVVEEVKP